MNQSKFDFCKFRSENSEKRTVPACCYISVVEGFYCYKRNLYRLSPQICEICNEYEQKDQENLQSEISAN